MTDCDLLIVGGGTGGCAAAMAAAHLGLHTVMTEPYDWVGGQLTSQCVPPDEHPWIEHFGCTARYRAFREGVRAHYRAFEDLKEDQEYLNPGGGWVSRLCHRPDIGHSVLRSMLSPSLDLRLGWIPLRTVTEKDQVVSVELEHTASKDRDTIRPRFVIDATETGDLLPMTGTDHLLGAEGKIRTAEPHAIDGPDEPDNHQGLTWCAVVGFDPHSDHTIERPQQYDFWRHYQPRGWPDKLLSFKMLHVRHGEVIDFPLFGNNGFNLFQYRQIVNKDLHNDDREDATVMNWPMNDYYLGTVVDAPVQEAVDRLVGARQLTLSMLYWLQTEAPRHDGGLGYPELRLRPDLTGTDDGLAMAPYVRESRRIAALHTIREQDVAADCLEDCDRANPIEDSVGVGAYRIDLHPSTNERPTIDLSSVPFQIPMRSLVPVRAKNLLPGCKNIGTTHITNGCFRLHPVEWNIGESAATLAAYCMSKGETPQDVCGTTKKVRDVQDSLRAQGVELEWPTVPLRAL